jgi:endo-1,4-beta-xylanase
VALFAALVWLCWLVAPAAAQDAPFSLRDDADGAGVNLGAAIADTHLDDPQLVRLARRHVNMLTFENDAKWATIHPRPRRYDFAPADRIARFARRNDMKMRGHVLIWHAENPQWLKDLTPTRREAKAVLRDHIFRVVGHFRRRFPGLITQWDVVNEGIDNDATRRQSIWQQWIGDDYIDLAFRWARRAAGPRVKLFYNDYFDAGMTAGAEAIGGEFDDGDAVPSALPGATGSLTCAEVAKCVAVRELVVGMLERGVPIDGVGFQAHLAGPAPSDHRGLTAWVGELGLDWVPTELDVPLPAGTEELGRATRQAEGYRLVAQACVDDPACNTIVTWGLSDRYTWWRTLVPGGIFTEALHFDEDYAAKPAATALHEVLAGG